MEELLIILSPVILGSIFALLNNDKVAVYDDNIVNWLNNKKNRLSEKRGKFSRFFLKPLTYSLLKIALWTKNIQNKGIRSGIRLASYLYIIGIAAFILFVFAYIIIGVVIILLLLWLVLFMLGSSEGSSGGRKIKIFTKGNKKYDSETGERVILQDGKTYRQTKFTGEWKPETNMMGNPKVETDVFGNPKIETEWTGKQKIEKDWKGEPIIPPDKKE